MPRKIENFSDVLAESLEWRACCECPAIWFGAIRCDFCGGLGEPIEQDIEPMILEIEEYARATMPN